VLSRDDFPHHHAARDAWLEYLCARQMTERLGWRRDDPQFGGWGYAKDLPLRPEPGGTVPALHEPNLSATVFALEALRMAGRRTSDTAIQDAKTFVQNCQNFSDREGDADATFDDGGFFFIHNDPTRNKAGVAGLDKRGRERYVSYGSTTADGLRGLLLCGLGCGAPRVVAARNWLTAHFDSDQHPGAYVAARSGSRAALDYYYCASLARAFHELDVRHVSRAPRTSQWASALAEGLLHRQGIDGSWRNPSVDVREDDPLVATSFAILALAVCRQHLGDCK
jgi:squalene-hopene/tetraprenyl-beta-curcumene cyclase